MCSHQKWTDGKERKHPWLTKSVFEHEAVGWCEVPHSGLQTALILASHNLHACCLLSK